MDHEGGRKTSRVGLIQGLTSVKVLGPGIDHICVWMGPAPLTLPSMHGLLVNTCAWTLPHWEPMWQYPVKIINIQVDIIFIIPKLIDKFLHMPKKLNGLRDWVLSHWFPTGPTGKSSTHMRARRPGIEGGVGRAGPAEHKCGKGEAQLNTIVDTHFWKWQQH